MKIFFILFLYISLINSQIIDYEKLVPIYRFYDIQEKSHYYKHSPGRGSPWCTRVCPTKACPTFVYIVCREVKRSKRKSPAV